MKIILLVVLLFFLQPSFLSAKISKKESLNQEKPLIEEQTMLDAGTWDLRMQSCHGKYRKNFIEKLAKLSWPDYKNYMKGGAKYDQGWTVTCNKKSEAQVKEFFDWIINTLESELKFKKTSTSNDSNKKNNKKKNEESENNNENTIEAKLKKLKSLFDQELITKQEYDKKRQEILDTM